VSQSVTRCNRLKKTALKVGCVANAPSSLRSTIFVDIYPSLTICYFAFCGRTHMPEYRRKLRPGGTYFFTLVTYRRRPIFSVPSARAALHRVICEVQSSHPFEIPAIVLLPDHLHCIWKMPENDDAFAMRWRLIKGRFTRLWLKEDGAFATHPTLEPSVSESRTSRMERGVWQRRFWEHVIRDQRDYARHMDYIHYNPVKHGYTRCPHLWEHSTFQRWLKEGFYLSNWHCQCHTACQPPDFKDIAAMAGE
jgi:putative transposase